MFLNSCQLHRISFYKNAVVKGYIINTSQDLLHNGSIASPSPPIEYYFVDKKDVFFENGNLFFKKNPKFYALSICEKEIVSYLKANGNVIYYENTKDGYMNYTILNHVHILIKKEVEDSKQFNHNQLKGYQICLNGKDTIEIIMNYHFKLVDLINVQ